MNPPSSSPSGAYRVEADLFSGRPNPAWFLSPADEEKLRLAVASAPPAPPAPSSSQAEPTFPDPGLGYRGLIIATLLSPEPVRLRIFAEHIERQGSSGKTMLWDKQRQLEQYLIATAKSQLSSELFEYISQAATVT